MCLFEVLYTHISEYKIKNNRKKILLGFLSNKYYEIKKNGKNICMYMYIKLKTYKTLTYFEIL